MLWVYKGAMAVSTRDEGGHKNSSPARSMLDDPQQSAPYGASPQHSAGAHCSTGTDRCGALLVVCFVTSIIHCSCRQDCLTSSHSYSVYSKLMLLHPVWTEIRTYASKGWQHRCVSSSSSTQEPPDSLSDAWFLLCSNAPNHEQQCLFLLLQSHPQSAVQESTSVPGKGLHVATNCPTDTQYECVLH